MGLLANGISKISNPLESDDTSNAIKVCKTLGAKVKVALGHITIESHFPLESKANKINTGDSGITTRFILPALGLRQHFNQPVIFDCGEQMQKRPIASLVKALNNLGMKISYLKTKGRCPLVVRGKLMGGKILIDGTTSQYLSALLMSLPLAPNGSEIKVKNLNERPYVEMTLKWLDSFGIKYSHQKMGNIDIYKIKGGQNYRAFKKTVPGDFSSASYIIAAGCLLAGKVGLKGLDMKDPQGDKRLVDILRRMGANIELSKSKITVKGGYKLRGVDVDAKDIPDLLPTLAVIGTQAKGKTRIYNVAQARIKETDRIKSMTEGLRRMGANIREQKNGLTIYQSKLEGALVKGFNDHRTVMALTIAGLLAKGKTIIKDAQAVDKTFPHFFSTLKRLGSNITLI